MFDQPASTPLLGSTLGRFRVVRRVGAGGMGVVYEALDAEHHMTVALKTLNHLEPDAIYRLKHEFRSLAGVLHPNLVKMHELSCVGGQWFFVMEYVDGAPLIEHVRGKRRTSPEATTLDARPHAPAQAERPHPPDGIPAAPSVTYAKIRSVLAQLVSGVSALHSLGKIHRDLKPSNVLVTREGRVVILDFGLTTDDQPEQSVQRALVGTPVYMAPEMFTGEWAGPAADWYAVGVILYEALVGVLPQRGAVRQLMSQKLFGEPARPRTLVPETPADLDDLCMRLLSRDPGARPTGTELEPLFPAPANGVHSSRPAPPSDFRNLRETFVGRRHELSVLRIALERIGAGKPVIVSVSGESGIGKSALVEAFLQRIRDERDVTILAGRCYEHESVPYKAFDQIADALSHYLTRCGDTEAALVMPRDPSALSTLFPVLARVPVVLAPPQRALPADPTELRLRGFAAFGELLGRLADRRRLVLSIDDLQWSDGDSALLLKDIFGGREPPGCLLVTTSRQARPDALRGVLSMIGDGDGERAGAGLEFVELQLRGLSDQESGELARRVGLGAPEERETVQAITEEAKGNPFFVSVLARSATPSTLGKGSLPSLMRSWVDALPERAARVLQVIAVAGRPIEEAAVAAAAGSDDIAADLSHLAAAHFIGAWPVPSRKVECYHDHIREVAIAGLAPEALSALHASLARALEAGGDADAQRLAGHFLAAGETAKGSLYAERAGDQASQALAFLDAARWYERALAHAGRDPARARDLQTRLGEAYSLAGRGASAAQWLLEAARTAPQHGALKLRQRAAELLLVSGHIDEGVRVLAEVLAHIRMKLPENPRRALAGLLWQRARLRLRGLGYVERSAAELSEDDLLRIDATWSVALGLSLVDPVRAADFQTRNLLLSLEGGEPYRIARALAMESGFHAVGGSQSEGEARRLSELATALAERVGDPHAVGLSLVTAGIGRYLLGHWAAASDLLARAEAVLLDLPGAIWELNAAQRFWLNSLAFIGDIPAIAKKVPALVKRARERGNLYAECNLRVRHCLLWTARDDPQGGIAETIDAMQRWSQEGFHLQHYNELFSHVNCALYEGRASDAMERVTSTWPRLKKSLLMRNQAVRIEARHLRTRVCLAYLEQAGADPAARATLEADVRELRGERIAWADAVASFADGLLLALERKTERAVQVLSKAEEELVAGDMHLLAATTRHRLGQLLGGEAGRARTSEARAWLSAHEVKNPDRFVAHYAPGMF